MTLPRAPNCHNTAWRQHKDEILGFLEHRADGVDEADDLLQEVFLKVLLQGKAFCELDNPRAWLFRVARNLLIDRRRLIRTRASFLPLADELPDDLVAESVPEIEPVDLLSHCLPSVLSRLSARDRDAIQFCDIQGVSLCDYAIRLGLSLPAAKSRLQRARRRLRSRLARSCRISYNPEGNVCCFVASSVPVASSKVD